MTWRSIKPKPLMYRVTFLLEHFDGRKCSYVVIANNASEAIDVATERMKKEHSPGRLELLEHVKPRWLDTDSNSPDLISPSAMEYFTNPEE